MITKDKGKVLDLDKLANKMKKKQENNFEDTGMLNTFISENSRGKFHK